MKLENTISNKHAWGNTTLQDFLDALVQGWQSNPDLDNIDIEGFWYNFLNTKGINTLKLKMKDTPEGINVDLKQHQGSRSDALIMQKWDLLIMKERDIFANDLICDVKWVEESDFEFSTISVMLNCSEDVQTIVIPEKSTSDTFILGNADDQAYIQFVLNRNLVNALSRGLLGIIPKSINRIIIWRSLISMVSKLLIKSTTFFNIIIENVVKEDDIILLNTIFPTIRSCANCYIPNEMYFDICQQMFERLYNKVISIPKEKEDLIDVFKSSLLSYLVNDEHIKLAATWLENGCITLRDGEKREDLYLKFIDQSYILARVCESEIIDIGAK